MVVDMDTQSATQQLSQAIDALTTILGKDMTVERLKHIPGITLSRTGTIAEIKEDPVLIQKMIIQEFWEVSPIVGEYLTLFFMQK